MLDKLEGVLTYVITAIIGCVGTGIWWLVRRALTDQKRIDLLQQDLEDRDRQRSEDREQIKEIRESVRRVESWIFEGRK